MATASQPALALIKPRKVLLLRGCLVGAAPLLRLPAVFSGLTLCSHHTVKGDFHRPKPCQGRSPFRRLWNVALALGPHTLSTRLGVCYLRGVIPRCSPNRHLPSALHRLNCCPSSQSLRVACCVMDPRHIRPPPMARETPYLPFTLRLKLLQLHRLHL